MALVKFSIPLSKCANTFPIFCCCFFEFRILNPGETNFTEFEFFIIVSTYEIYSKKCRLCLHWKSTNRMQIFTEFYFYCSSWSVLWQFWHIFHIITQVVNKIYASVTFITCINEYKQRANAHMPNGIWRTVNADHLAMVIVPTIFLPAEMVSNSMTSKHKTN